MAKEQPTLDNQDDFTEEIGSHEQGTDVMQTLLIKAPSWLGSAVVHAVILLIFTQIQWTGRTDKDPTVEARIKEPELEQVEEEEEPERPEVPEDPEIVDSRLPPADVTFIPDVEMEQPDVDVPGFNELEPDEDPPLAIAKLALGTEGAAGHFHGVWNSRGGSGRKKSLLRFGGSRRSEETVNHAFGWLARVQEADGHWDCTKWGGGGHDAAVTGLALLAFLGHGETDREGKYRLTVRKSLEWLERNQNNDGGWPGNFYTQGICTMAVCEAYGMTRNPAWKKMAQSAINNLCANQNPKGAWDYGGNNPERVDTSVTGWCVMGVKSGVAAGLDVPSEAIERIKNWLRTSVNAQGLTGYAGTPGTAYGGSAPMTAAATLCRQFMGWERDHPDMEKALAYLKGKANLQNMYHTYYMTLVMFQAGGEFWDDYNKAFRDPLIDKQVRGRGPQFDGSWDTGIQYGQQGGRVYSTAMSVFCLEIYYRFLPVLK